MIYDKLDNLETYAPISERLAKGLQLLRTTDFSAMEDGKYEVDGKSLFFMLQSYDSKPVNDRPEAHRKYIDIQYLLKGEEYIGVAPLSEMTEEVSANPDGDIWFYHGPVTNVKIGPYYLHQGVMANTSGDKSSMNTIRVTRRSWVTRLRLLS